jgi:hypothetical protein
VVEDPKEDAKSVMNAIKKPEDILDAPTETKKDELVENKTLIDEATKADVSVAVKSKQELKDEEADPIERSSINDGRDIA